MNRHPIIIEILKYKPLFLDTEFTELRQSASLISLAIIADTDETFYAEFTEVEFDKLSDWHKENVVSNLFLDKPSTKPRKSQRFFRGSTEDVTRELLGWMQQLSKKYEGQTFQFWADVPHYDWVFFCELFGGARALPSYIHYMPMDIATLLLAKNVDPSKDRMSLLKDVELKGLKPHNALFDANIAKEVYHKFLLK